MRQLFGTQFRHRGEAAISMLRTIVSLHKYQKRCGQAIVFIATPIYSNLGDHAIVKAQIKFLSDMGYSNNLFEISRSQYECGRRVIQSIVQSESLIVIDGGGNVGTLWSEESEKMNDIIERFSGNPVVVFPQTAFFEDSPVGEECRRNVSLAYAKNPNLVFFSRDRATYNAMRKVSPRTLNLYAPDIVLYLDESRDGDAREGALLCMRDDKERVTDGCSSAAIRSALADRRLAVHETSTVVNTPCRIDASNRDAVLDSKWDEFRSAEVVVTDRLHGMIFSGITGTPCVALDNVSRKVSQGYEWIRHIPNIRVAASADEVPGLLDAVLDAGPCRYDRAPLDPYYDQMKAAIRRAIR